MTRRGLFNTWPTPDPAALSLPIALYIALSTCRSLVLSLYTTLSPRHSLPISPPDPHALFQTMPAGKRTTLPPSAQLIM